MANVVPGLPGPNGKPPRDRSSPETKVADPVQALGVSSVQHKPKSLAKARDSDGASPVLPVIDMDRCDGCKECLPVCPVGALQVVRGKARILHSSCDYCGECEAACPTGAISCPFDILLQ